MPTDGGPPVGTATSGTEDASVAKRYNGPLGPQGSAETPSPPRPTLTRGQEGIVTAGVGAALLATSFAWISAALDKDQPVLELTTRIAFIAAGLILGVIDGRRSGVGASPPVRRAITTLSSGPSCVSRVRANV
jgi:hypothetical protein